MRIVYCTPEISHPGGIARVTAIKTNWLAEHGHDVYIVTSSQCGETDFFDLHPKVKHIDMGIGFQAGMDNSNIIKKIIKKRGKMREYEKRLREFLYEVKADIVVSTFCNDSDFLYKFNDGSKKVLEFHFSHDGFKSVIKYGHLGLLRNIVELYKIRKQEIIAKKYDAFVVLTREDAVSWRGYKNLHVIPNMLSFESNEVAECKTKSVIAVGRLDYQKKFDRLIEIWEQVCKVCPDWRLDIFGQGPDRQLLQEMIENKRLDKYIYINEPTPNIKEEYLQSSIFVMTSTYEGLPMTLLEAESLGLPVVSYSFKCGPKDVINNGENGYLIEEEDKVGFVNALITLMKDSNLRQQMGRKAKEYSSQWSVDNIMRQWMKLFSEL